MRKELVIPWQFKGQQGYTILMCRKWKRGFLESSCHQKVLVVLLFVKVIWRIHLLSEESDILLCFSLSVKTCSCDYKCLIFFFGVLPKTVGLHTELAYDDIDEHWSKLTYICKMFVVHKNTNRQIKQTCLSRRRYTWFCSSLLWWSMWVLIC